MNNIPPLEQPSPHSQTRLSIEEAVGRAYAHWNAGQADQATLFCQRILAAWPGHTDALHLMGIMAHADGNLRLAISQVRQACLAPRAPAVYFSNLAELCREGGLLVEGEEAGRRSIALDPSLVAAWNNLGIILQEQGKLEESLVCLQRAISLQPDYAEAHNNVGNTYKRLGLLTRAEDCYTRAVALLPNYAVAHSNLATLLNDLGRVEEAVVAAQHAIALNPHLADGYINMAAIETTRLNHAEALRWLESLARFAPNHGEGLSARAMALKHVDRLDDALETARQAVAAMPDNAEAHNAMGQILQASGQPEAALQAYERASQLPGGAAESALINRAVLFMEDGRKDEAKAAFERALAAFPRSATAWFNQADFKTFTADDPDIVRMQDLLNSGSVQSHADQISLHFALGKAYLDAGLAAPAFEHLGHGNRLKRATFTYDANATSAWMARIAETFTPALMKRLGGGGVASPMPIFVVGMPRSGTTLIEQIIASHPAVSGAGELPYVQTLVNGLPGYPQALSGLEKADMARLGQDYLDKIIRLADGKAHVIDKMPANFLYAGLITLMLPGAKIVHCRRDPVDTCLSCYTKMFSAEQLFAYDLQELGQFHRDYQHLMAHWRATLPADRFIEVDYEAIVGDISGQAQRLIAFLGLPWDEACVRFHENRRIIKTASLNQVRQPLYGGSVGRWKPHAAHLMPLLDALGVTVSVATVSVATVSVATVSVATVGDA